MRRNHWDSLDRVLSFLQLDTGLSYWARVFFMRRPFQWYYKFWARNLDHDLWPTFHIRRLCSLYQDLSSYNICFNCMTLIVTFDVLSKKFNIFSILFYCKRQGYHVWHVWCIKQDFSVVVITRDLWNPYLDMSITDDSTESKNNPSCSMSPALIKAIYSDYFSILHFSESLFIFKEN